MTIDRAGGLRQPVLVGVGRRGRRVRAPDQDACGVAARCADRSRSAERAVDVVERDVAGLVADRVGVDLGRAEPVEEPEPEGVGEQRAGAGVVGVQDRLGRRRPSTMSLQRAAISAIASSQLTGSKRPSPLAPPRRSGAVSRACGSRHDAVVADRALAAELAAADRVVGVAAHRPDGAVPDGRRGCRRRRSSRAGRWSTRSGRSPGQSSRHRRWPPSSAAAGHRSPRSRSTDTWSALRFRPPGTPAAAPIFHQSTRGTVAATEEIRPLEWSRRRQPWPPVASAGLTGPACLPPAARYALPRFTGRPRPASTTRPAAPAAARRWPVPGRTAGR